MAKFTAGVRKRVTYRSPALNTSGKPVLLGPDGKELPKDDSGAYVGTGTPKLDTTQTDTFESPLCDESGNPLEAGTVEAMLRKVKEHFAEEEDTEILRVTILETKTIGEYSGDEVRKL